MLYVGTVIAQKLTLTDTSYKNWAYIEPGYTQINDDGNFFYYQINNKPIGQNTFVVSATDKSWQQEFTSSANFNFHNFTADGRYFFLLQGDTLVQVNLRSKQISNIPNCKGYSLQQQGKKAWLIYQLNTSGNELKIQNLINGTIYTYPDVLGYNVDPNKNIIVLKRKRDAEQEILTWLDLTKGKQKEIYKGQQTHRLIFSPVGQNLAFYTLKDGQTTIWYYNPQQQAAKQVADDSFEGIAKDHVIATDIWRFSNDGEDLFFNQKVKSINKGNGNPDPIIWSFQDAFLKTCYNPIAYESGLNLSVLYLKKGKVRQLLSGMQKADLNQQSTDVFVAQSSFGRGDELPWNICARVSYYLLFTKTGELRPIKENVQSALAIMQLSPNDNFLIYYDVEQEIYYSYDLKYRQTIQLEKLAGGAGYINEFTRNVDNNTALGIDCWIDGSNCAIIQGRYDLWEVDVAGKKKPINLTKIGLEKRIIFGIWNKYKVGAINSNEPIYVTGFNLNDKSYGLYKLDLSKRTMDSLCVTKSGISNPYGEGVVFQPGKKGVLIAHQAASSSLNYSFSSDFKTFTQLTDIHPEADYNWMTAELVKYSDKDGNICEGKLYKPENFDSTKKYPIIFYYYWDNSDELNYFILPDPKSKGFNIPMLVSTGYLVFWPNIYSEKYQPGESALKSVLAGADYLSQFKWVDTSKMAISGHSWGAYVTNYIVTHTSRFKAAISFAGPSNLIQMYNDLWPDAGFSFQGFLKGFFGMVDGLEINASNYLKNSPVIHAKSIGAPLLLIHNNKDERVSANHSTQLFVQLRSLNKPVWFLQYENEGHVFYKIENQVDCQRKMLSFFDHYLKNKQMPNWMTKHISSIQTQ